MNEIFSLNEFLPYKLHKTAEIVASRFATTYDKYDINRQQWRIVFHLGTEKTLTASEICKCANLYKTEVSRAINDLEEKGWVKRSKNVKDRRFELLSLTNSGINNYYRLVAESARFQSQIYAQLGATNATKLDRLLTKLAKIE